MLFSAHCCYFPEGGVQLLAAMPLLTNSLRSMISITVAGLAG